MRTFRFIIFITLDLFQCESINGSAYLSLALVHLSQTNSHILSHTHLQVPETSAQSNNENDQFKCISTEKGIDSHEVFALTGWLGSARLLASRWLSSHR